jgi:hypothetical protein
MELMIYGEQRDTILANIRRLASLTGVGVEERDQRVILKVLPEGKSHSKE